VVHVRAKILALVLLALQTQNVWTGTVPEVPAFPAMSPMAPLALAAAPVNLALVLEVPVAHALVGTALGRLVWERLLLSALLRFKPVKHRAHHGMVILCQLLDRRIPITWTAITPFQVATL